MVERIVTEHLNEDQKAMLFDNHKLIPGYVQRYFVPHLKRMNISKSQVETIIEESVQKAYMDICERMHTFDPSKGKFSTWVYNTLRFTVRNHFESKIKPDMLVISREDNRENVSVDEIYDEDFNVDKDSIKAAISELEEKERTMVDLVFYKDFTIEEAASELSVTIKEAVDIRQKAILTLRNTILTHYEKEESEVKFEKACEIKTNSVINYEGKSQWKKWYNKPENKEKSKQYLKKWIENNKEKSKQYLEKYKAKKKAERSSKGE